MKSISVILGVLSILSLHGQEKTTYDDHAFPIFQQTCLNCHNPDKNKGGLDLSSYSGAMKGGSGGKIAIPGDTGSKLLSCLTAEGDLKMPPEGDRVSPSNIAVIKQWIETGLLETKNSTARKPEKPRFQIASQSPQQKPDGPPPLPIDLLLEPLVKTKRGSSIHSLAAAPWAPLIAATSQRQILLFHSQTLELIGIIPFPAGEPQSITFTPDSRYLVVAGGIPAKSGTTLIFDVVTGRQVLQVAKEFDSILAADIRPEFDVVATGSSSRMVKIWDSNSGELIKSIKKHTDWVTSLDLSADGVLLATGDRNGGIYVWEAATGGEFHTLRAHQEGITQLSFRSDSNILASSSEDGTIRFWEMNGGSEVKKIDAHPGGVVGVTWAQNGTILTAGRDKKAKLWKADFQHLRDSSPLPHLPTALCITPDATRCFVGDDQGSISVIDSSNGKIIATLNNNPPTIAERLVTIEESIKSASSSAATLQKSAAEAAEKLKRHQEHIQTLQQRTAKAKQSFHKASQATSAIETNLKKSQQDLADQKNLEQSQRALQATSQNELELAKTALTSAQQAGQAETIGLAIQHSHSCESKNQTLLASLTEITNAIQTLTQTEQQFTKDLTSATQTKDTHATEIKAAEVELQAAKSALPTLEKSSSEATSAAANLPQRIANLHQQKQHWSAATINTDYLQSAKIANQEQTTFQEKAVTFTTLAATLTSQYAAEKKATIPEEQSKITKERQNTERELIALKQQINSQTSQRTQATSHATNLKKQYIAAQQKITE